MSKKHFLIYLLTASVSMVILTQCNELDVEFELKGDKANPGPRRLSMIPGTNFYYMIIDGGEDPVSDPNPSEDGDFDCKTAKGGNCLEVTVWGLVAYDGLIDAINNSETHVYFSDPEEPYFDIFSDSAFLYFLPQLQTGDLIMIKANNDAFCVVNNTYDPIETGWNEDSILFAYPYEFE